MPVTVGLGTVQLGLPYGNRAGQDLLPEADAFTILERAVAAQVAFYDTAIAYGESEARLGRFGLARRAPAAVISTKLPRVAAEVWQNVTPYVRSMLDAVTESRERLGLATLELLQFHQSDLPFLTSKAAPAVMDALLSSGQCRRIGVSVYTPEEAFAALALPQVTALQVPASLVDRRFLTEELGALRQRRGAQLILRSIFLQGVLADPLRSPLPPVARATALQRLRDEALAVLRPAGIGLGEAALRFAFANLDGVADVALVGVDKAKDLDDNLQAARAAAPLPAELDRSLAALGASAAASGLLDPSRWSIP
jgi:aryl-alcohol dehydrogenase-like predicted oxidoreductase